MQPRRVLSTARGFRRMPFVRHTQNRTGSTNAPTHRCSPGHQSFWRRLVRSIHTLRARQTSTARGLAYKQLLSTYELLAHYAEAGLREQRLNFNCYYSILTIEAPSIFLPLFHSIRETSTAIIGGSRNK